MDMKEFDCLIKGRFYQAPQKWQCKLGALKATESFDDLFTRARMFERHEQQFSASSASRNNTSQKGNKTKNKDESQNKPQANSELKNEATASQSCALVVRMIFGELIFLCIYRSLMKITIYINYMH